MKKAFKPIKIFTINKPLKTLNTYNKSNLKTTNSYKNTHI